MKRKLKALDLPRLIRRLTGADVDSNFARRSLLTWLEATSELNIDFEDTGLSNADELEEVAGTELRRMLFDGLTQIHAAAETMTDMERSAFAVDLQQMFELMSMDQLCDIVLVSSPEDDREKTAATVERVKRSEDARLARKESRDSEREQKKLAAIASKAKDDDDPELYPEIEEATGMQFAEQRDHAVVPTAQRRKLEAEIERVRQENETLAETARRHEMEAELEDARRLNDEIDGKGNHPVNAGMAAARAFNDEIDKELGRQPVDAG